MESANWFSDDEIIGGGGEKAFFYHDGTRIPTRLAGVPLKMYKHGLFGAPVNKGYSLWCRKNLMKRDNKGNLIGDPIRCPMCEALENIEKIAATDTTHQAALQKFYEDYRAKTFFVINGIPKTGAETNNVKLIELRWSLAAELKKLCQTHNTNFTDIQNGADIVIYKPGKTWVLELRYPEEPEKRSMLTKEQIASLKEWDEIIKLIHIHEEAKLKEYADLLLEYVEEKVYSQKESDADKTIGEEEEPKEPEVKTMKDVKKEYVEQLPKEKVREPEPKKEKFSETPTTIEAPTARKSRFSV